MLAIALGSLILSGCTLFSPQPSAEKGQDAPPEQPQQLSQAADKPSGTPGPPPPKPQPEPVPQTFALPDDRIDFTNLVIEADISEQMIYFKQDGKIVRAMRTSSGLDTGPETATPRGEFVIEPERGEWFFAPQYGEGARYWVSFKNHGEFLFHSVVMDENRQVIEAEARKLGTKASHGCFRLLLEDAKWIYDNIPTGTKVIIHE